MLYRNQPGPDGQIPVAGRGRGRGRGMGGGGTGQGFGGECTCPNCGYREPHQWRVPCYNKKCPKCMTPLMRV